MSHRPMRAFTTVAGLTAALLVLGAVAPASAATSVPIAAASTLMNLLREGKK